MSDKKGPLLPLWPFASSGATAPTPSTSEYKWPSLVNESCEMMESATMIYALADLRVLARKELLSNGDIVAGERMMSLPVTVGDVFQVLSSDKETLPAIDVWQG
jgi:hypothetical protein